jgi:putative transposase
MADIKTTRFTDEQIICFLKQAEAGAAIKDICRSAGVARGLACLFMWLSP